MCKQTICIVLYKIYFNNDFAHTLKKKVGIFIWFILKKNEKSISQNCSAPQHKTNQGYKISFFIQGTVIAPIVCHQVIHFLTQLHYSDYHHSHNYTAQHANWLSSQIEDIYFHRKIAHKCWREYTAALSVWRYKSQTMTFNVVLSHASNLNSQYLKTIFPNYKDVTVMPQPIWMIFLWQRGNFFSAFMWSEIHPFFIVPFFSNFQFY